MAIHKSAMGRAVDMAALSGKNEKVRAVGNMGVNARGDKIGPGGKIIAKREQMNLPEQVTIRPPAQPAAPVAETAPAKETPVKPLTAAQKAKMIKDMDPEGNE